MTALATAVGGALFNLSASGHSPKSLLAQYAGELVVKVWVAVCAAGPSNRTGSPWLPSASLPTNPIESSPFRINSTSMTTECVLLSVRITWSEALHHLDSGYVLLSGGFRKSKNAFASAKENYQGWGDVTPAMG